MVSSLFRLILSALCFTPCLLHAQSVAVNVNGDPGHASAIFDVGSTDKGVLLPRMTLLERNAISDPAEGLLIYQRTGEAGFYVFSGGAWKPIAGESAPPAEMPRVPETATAYSTDFYTTATGWGLVPGMSTTVTVPPGETANVLITADIGLVTNGTGNNNRSCTDLAVVRDYALLPEGGYKRVTAGTGDESAHNNYIKNPVITGHEVLGPGTYTYSLAAVQQCNGGQSRNAVLGGGAGSILQGTLTVTLNFL